MSEGTSISAVASGGFSRSVKAGPHNLRATSLAKELQFHNQLLPSGGMVTSRCSQYRPEGCLVFQKFSFSAAPLLVTLFCVRLSKRFADGRPMVPCPLIGRSLPVAGTFVLYGYIAWPWRCGSAILPDIGGNCVSPRRRRRVYCRCHG